MTRANERTRAMIQRDAGDRQIADRLRSARLDVGLSLTEVAIRTGYPEEEIAAHEAADLWLPASRLWTICSVLRLDPLEILALAPDYRGC